MDNYIEYFIFTWYNGFSKMECLPLYCISLHSSLHILIQLSNGQVLATQYNGYISLTLEIGIRKSRPKDKIVRVKITTNTTKAAFSKSVS